MVIEKFGQAVAAIDQDLHENGPPRMSRGGPFPLPRGGQAVAATRAWTGASP